MKTFSNDFRSSLNEIRQLNGTVCYYSTDGYSVLSQENDGSLLTESGFKLLTEKGYITYDGEAIINIRPMFEVSLFKTICKFIQIEAIHKIDKGTPICAKIGVLVNGSYEYMEYGNFKIIEEPTYKADTKSYLMVGYDKMVESMVKYDDNPLSVAYPITHKNLVIAICNHFNWTYNLSNYTNYDKLIDTDLYKDQGMTYRDILDDLCQAIGTNFIFDLDDIFTTKDITETNTTIDDNYIKDINVNLGEKYGKVNALTITSEETTVINNKEDSASIIDNGKTEFNINNNKLLMYASDLFINDLFTKINGLEYYLYDIDTTGLLIYEPLDRFTINHNGLDYTCVMLNNDTQLTQGLVETIYADKPQETQKEYISNAIDNTKLKNALFSIDKTNGQIVLKATSDGKLVQAELKADAESGSEFNVKADNINLEGYTTINNGFSVNETGSVTIRDGDIELQDTGSQTIPKIVIYNVDDPDNKRTEFNSNGISIKDESNSIQTSYLSSGIEINDTYGSKYFNYNGITHSNNYGGSYASFEYLPNLFLITSQGLRSQFLLDCSTPSGLNDNMELILNNNQIFQATVNGFTYYTGSLETLKKNIKKSDLGLDLIKNTDIYTYNYKTEKNNHKKHIGVIIGNKYNTPKEILNDENNGIDTYSMVSVCINAIKQQQEQIENLQKQINELKESE